MINLLFSKTKIQAFDFHIVPAENFEIIGIGQINQACKSKYDGEILLTVINFANETKKFDEREGITFSDYFTRRKCLRCRREELLPTKIKINSDNFYLKNEEKIANRSRAYKSYNEDPLSRRQRPSIIEAYCPECGSCFSIMIKSCDLWIREARKIKEKDLIGEAWDEYRFDGL